MRKTRCSYGVHISHFFFSPIYKQTYIMPLMSTVKTVSMFTSFHSFILFFKKHNLFNRFIVVKIKINIKLGLSFKKSRFIVWFYHFIVAGVNLETI